MMKPTMTAAIAAMALFASASMHTARAAESDFHGYTKMPKASGPHTYTPAPADKNGAKTYSPYTKMPTGSVAQAPHPNAQTNQQPNSQSQK